jgi:gluconate 2-dehydrogenase alpha chain
MTFNLYENDWKMSAFLTDKAAQIARAVGARVVGNANPRRGNFDGRAGQTTHNTGGTIMGVSPNDSVVNRYLQSWDVPNLFIIGASNFPQNATYNPTDTVGALAYMSAEAIVQRYIKKPGPLVQA